MTVTALEVGTRALAVELIRRECVAWLKSEIAAGRPMVANVRNGMLAGSRQRTLQDAPSYPKFDREYRAFVMWLASIDIDPKLTEGPTP